MKEKERGVSPCVVNLAQGISQGHDDISNSSNHLAIIGGDHLGGKILCVRRTLDIFDLSNGSGNPDIAVIA